MRGFVGRVPETIGNELTCRFITQCSSDTGSVGLASRVEVGYLERFGLGKRFCDEEVGCVARENFDWSVEILNWVPI